MHFFFKKYFICVFVLIINSLTSTAQTHKLTGKTKDSLQKPVPNTNIIATPMAEDVGITFAISSLDGEYKLKLQNNINYQIAITHLGYKKITDTVTLTADKVKNYTLQESTETLEEVLIKAEMAVIVKEDTFIFTTEKFQIMDYITSYSINSYSLFYKTQFIL